MYSNKNKVCSNLELVLQYYFVGSGMIVLCDLWWISQLLRLPMLYKSRLWQGA